MAKKLMYPVVAVVGLALASGLAWWFQSRTAPPPLITVTSPAVPRAASVEVVQVQRMSLQDDAQSVGSLQSRQSVMLRPEVAGRIKALGFSDGTPVRQGQVLVQLDDTLQRAEVRQAQAQVSIAQANFKRNQELVAENFVAQRVLDESAANVQVVEAQLALADARLSRMAILAPFNGTVGIRNINLGDYVKDGADLVNLEDISSMYLDFRLPERYLSKLQREQAVTVTLDAFPGRTFQARIQAIDPLLDANGRSVSVRAVLPNTRGQASPASADPGAAMTPAAPLRPGMFARVTTVFSVNETAVVVPESAIVPQDGRQYVIKAVAAPTGAAGALVSRRQEVSLGLRRQGQVEITEGLSEGQTVVVAGQQRLQRDGMALRVVTLGQPVPASRASAATVSR